MLHNEQIERNFTFHPATETQAIKYKSIHNNAKALAHLIHKLCPDSRERSLAITHLENTVMWANASIARHAKINIHPDEAGLSSSVDPEDNVVELT